MTSRTFKALSWISLMPSSVSFSIWYMMGLVLGVFLCCQSLSFSFFLMKWLCKSPPHGWCLGLFYRCVHLNDDRKKSKRLLISIEILKKIRPQYSQSEVTLGSKWINQWIKVQWVMELSKLLLQYLKSLVETVGIAVCSLESLSVF